MRPHINSSRCRASAWRRSLTRGILAVGVSLAGLAATADAPQIEAQGVVQDLDFGASRLVISGIEYTVSPAAEVSIRGSFGAFTMLQEGMKVEFIYLRHANDNLEITQIDQVPDNTAVLLY